MSLTIMRFLAFGFILLKIDPLVCILYGIYALPCGSVAQSVEQWPFNPLLPRILFLYSRPENKRNADCYW